MNESEMYFQTIVDAFELSSRLLCHENTKISEFAMIAMELQKLKEIKPTEQFWNSWPRNPTSFPLYFRAGMSALDVADKFRESIDGCIQIGKLKSIEHFRTEEVAARNPDYRVLSERSLKAWMDCTFSLISELCISSKAIERFREVDLMRRKLYLEIATWRESKASLDNWELHWKRMRAAKATHRNIALRWMELHPEEDKTLDDVIKRSKNEVGRQKVITAKTP